MNGNRLQSSAKAPNRFTHGLFSRRTKELWLRSVEDMAAELIDKDPKTSHTLRAARDLAHTIFLLRAIRSEKDGVVSSTLSPRHDQSFTEAIGLDEIEQEDGHHRLSIEEALEHIRQVSRELAKLDRYERKALSRLRKQINTFDYVIIETRRQASAQTKTPRI